MSVRTMDWVFTNAVVDHRGDLLVLLALAWHAGDDGTSAYPSVATLASKARLTRRGVQLALRRLQDAGAIEATGTGPRGTTEYRIVTGEATTPREVASPGEATSRANSRARGGELSDTMGANPTSPELSEELSEEPSDASSGTSEIDEWPEDLSDDVRTTAVAVRQPLLRLHRAKPRSISPPLAAIGRVLASMPDRDHVAVADDVEHYWTFGAGQNKSMRDIVATYRNRLKTAPIIGSSSNGRAEANGHPAGVHVGDLDRFKKRAAA